MSNLLITAMVLVGAPLLGGLLTGVDRRLTARLQSRVGPPLAQPFYDVFKLMGKDRVVCNNFQMISVAVYLAATVLSLLMLLLGQDLLVMLFVLGLGHVMLILGGFSVKSPYSQLGSQREVLQMLAYEPLLVFMVVAVYLRVGSFQGHRVVEMHQPLLLTLPVFWFTQTLVLAIKLHKSPFDVSASSHAHQELVRGIYTEFSGTQLALIELAHFYELVFLLASIGILWHTSLVVGACLALVSLAVVVLVDNTTARLSWRWMVGFAWGTGATLAVANLGVLYLLLPAVPRGGP
jgi:ech hydrogenase subunit B